MIAVLGEEDGVSAFAPVRGASPWPQAMSITAHDAVNRREDGRMCLVRRGTKVERALMGPGKGRAVCARSVFTARQYAQKAASSETAFLQSG